MTLYESYIISKLREDTDLNSEWGYSGLKPMVMETAINALTEYIHRQNVEVGWWNDINTREDLHGKRNIGELLMLVVSELSEALDGDRKNNQDKHLTNYPAFSVELSDAVIRIFDIAGSMNIPLGTIIFEKLAYNRTREDHKQGTRQLNTGKKY